MVSKQLQRIALAAYISVVCFRTVRLTATAVASQTSGAVSHDTFQRILATKRARWSRRLWKRAKKHIKSGGYLIIDDTVINKEASSWKTEMTATLWSASEKRYLYGHNVVVLLWTDGKTRVLLDVQFWVRGGKKTKLDLAVQMLRAAKQRGVCPEAVLFDSWYAAASLLKAVRALGWHWVTRLKANRKLDDTCQVRHRWQTTYGSSVAMLTKGIKAFVVKDGNAFFATSHLDWKPKQVKKAYRKRWIIEEVIKILKSELGFETCQARSIAVIRAHAYLCLMSFNRLEEERLKHGFATIYQLRSVLFQHPIPFNDAWQLDLRPCA